MRFFDQMLLACARKLVPLEEPHVRAPRLLGTCQPFLEPRLLQQRAGGQHSVDENT